jgi:hypothetical protein
MIEKRRQLLSGADCRSPLVILNILTSFVSPPDAGRIGGRKVANARTPHPWDRNERGEGFHALRR